jgi:hypothetical protein
MDRRGATGSSFTTVLILGRDMARNPPISPAGILARGVPRRKKPSTKKRNYVSSASRLATGVLHEISVETLSPEKMIAQGVKRGKQP